MTLSTALTRRLNIQHPVLLAPMDLVADAKLCDAVSAAGGFGMLGGGYGDEAWLRREMAVLQARPVQRPHGIGFITWSLAKQPQLLDLALESRPAAVMLSFGDPTPFIDKIKAAGALAICQVQTVAMARQAAAEGADIIVAQGGEAGGHGVSRGTLGLVPAVVDAVPAMLPVVAAGGIGDGRGLAAALSLGAAGVLVGTRFYATHEAAGFPQAKARICAASGDDTARSIVFDISRENIWPAPFNGRCLVNDHARRWMGREVELMRNVREEAVRYREARAAGDFSIAAVIAGEAADTITEVVSARNVVETMVSEAEDILIRLSGQLAA
ncbi:nitronate monooxygenase [Ferrovibrio terrae]|uniref:NAD(P)H-dependent flavin oxidoreductase n=1 Tax=Ferrovibrio terrae TaxID=2594003 RepID=UPI003137AC93